MLEDSDCLLLLTVCFQVEGGSGSVKWEVSDSEIATVTVKGVVLAGKRRGQAEILVSDSKNILHKVVGKVKFAQSHKHI